MTYLHVAGIERAYGYFAPNVPAKFKEVAFALKNGEVSDPVEAENAFHLIKVENRIPPKAVQFLRRLRTRRRSRSFLPERRCRGTK